MSDHILVTGGAGYIGSHACKRLAAAGYVPVTFDNLSTGWRDAVKFGPLVEGNLLDPDALARAFAAFRPVAVMHFAALSQVGESMAKPGLYWRENVLGALNLIEAALAADCRRMVFSSTCATYGDHDGVLLEETTSQRPLNAYGGSKLAIERILADFGASDGLESVIFRYFNVAGADPEAEIGEFHRPETHLIPLVLDAICGRRDKLVVNGTDYPTRDGTCMRDYVHVMDLVDAHVLGLEWLRAGKGNAVFCLGSGQGFTVREVMDAAARITGKPAPMQAGPRRAGDAVSLVSGSEAAAAQLGWCPTRSTLDQMIGDAWRWHQSGAYSR